MLPVWNVSVCIIKIMIQVNVDVLMGLTTLFFSISFYFVCLSRLLTHTVDNTKRFERYSRMPGSYVM